MTSKKMSIPAETNYDNMTPQSKKLAQKKYKKAVANVMLKHRCNEAKRRSLQWESITYSGDNMHSLRPMEIVKMHRLKEGDNFVEKEMIKQ